MEINLLGTYNVLRAALAGGSRATAVSRSI